MAMKRTYCNPIVPGFAPDPSVVFVDGVFFLVTSSFHIFPGLPIYASTDLQGWRHIAVMPLDTGNIMVASAGLFAPTIRYYKGTFYIVCTNTTHDEDTFSLDNFYITTTDIWSGNWTDPIHFSFNGIDPSLYFDDDGRVYVQGCWMIDRLKQPSCTIKQFEMDIATGKALTEAREIWGGFARYDTEGPHIYKRGGYYYLLVAEGGTFEHHLLSIGRSKDIWGPYESCDANPIMTADGKTDEYIQNIGHGELFQDQSGAWWAAVLGVRNENDRPPLGRETFLTAVDWPEDGWPTIQQPTMEFERVLSGPVGGNASLIHKTPANLDLVYIRDPECEMYHISGETDLVLRCSASNLSIPTGTSTFIGKRQRSIDASASVSLDISNAFRREPVEAGLAMYKDAPRHVSLTFDFQSSEVVFNVTTTSEDKTQSTSIPVNTSTTVLGMRVEANAQEYTFLYRENDSEDWNPVGRAQVADLVEREMTGPIFGVFAHAMKDGTVGAERLLYVKTDSRRSTNCLGIMDLAQLPPWDLPPGVTSRYVDTSPIGLKFHILESFPKNNPSKDPPPLILLLHGFPNLSFDWSAVMPKLAAAGYYAVAPDMRGFGRTHNANLSPISEETIRPLTALRDVVTLVHALGYESIHTLVGHDLGAFVASMCAITRPDMIKSLVLMAHPFKGSPQLPLGTGPAPQLASLFESKREDGGKTIKNDNDIQSCLLKLDPPRKHYKYYNASSGAVDEWTHPTGQPMHEFLRGYFHLKSADYSLNNPRPLEAWTAQEISVMPHYYVMRADLSMRGNIELDMAQESAEVRAKLSETSWLTDAELQVYVDEYSRNTFRLSLLWYKVLIDPALSADLLCFAGTKLAIPTKYVSGTHDWGTYQVPGALEAMENGESVRSDCWMGSVIIPGAGHWVNIEKSEETAQEIITLAQSL
ncbi:xylosidase/arabinosidase [Colletotrichum tamarilloi]|uniref:Xylosidase/arabinosidase n=1 Tax=Colletotrichum tamarilloi TaxID=1209934 RepID=A0ABQ9QVG4_9PEZI|nr:xylosidase/arabinosidase [Colletotrichum tamarilloi]KAK1486422.1 xylosidase/arabinosidase [Colletotrichum tamarilloi]